MLDPHVATHAGDFVTDTPISDLEAAGAVSVDPPTPPRVSIVMPTYNSAEHLASTVDSVLAQTFPGWELVLFDDGSTDTTIELSDELVRRDRRIRSATGGHLGPAAARNGGFDRSDPRSEFVTFLDSDDTWEPYALETLVATLDRQANVVAVHAVARATDMDGRQFDDDVLGSFMRSRRVVRGSELVELPLSAPTPFDAMLVENFVVTPGTTLIRRSALTAIGGLDPATSPADDWDLNIRLARLGDFAFVDQVVLNWRRHPDSLANTSKRLRHGYLAVRRKSIASRDNTPEQRRAALALLERDCRGTRRLVLTNVRSRQLRAAAGLAYYALQLHAELLRARLRR
jgi:glycosyltransferase involved in cell wall biosynthesis